jgi:hypothetical protein
MEFDEVFIVSALLMEGEDGEIHQRETRITNKYHFKKNIIRFHKKNFKICFVLRVRYVQFG